ncbi:hypothetical protein HYFRA_00001992 [Hymenoscyphus fraxineus]|uniref:Uncharacterized protein n=1 Tax=Hymenoscyphus fraxineus TaxID=746836 RepID=A0A9N9KJR1_9HELO|nr:hypothetical protein HYFRA_00001992 [Hymenoscyphus fraxineus]
MSFEMDLYVIRRGALPIRKAFDIPPPDELLNLLVSKRSYSATTLTTLRQYYRKVMKDEADNPVFGPLLDLLKDLLLTPSNAHPTKPKDDDSVMTRIMAVTPEGFRSIQLSKPRLRLWNESHTPLSPKTQPVVPDPTTSKVMEGDPSDKLLHRAMTDISTLRQTNARQIQSFIQSENSERFLESMLQSTAQLFSHCQERNHDHASVGLFMAYKIFSQNPKRFQDAIKTTICPGAMENFGGMSWDPKQFQDQLEVPTPEMLGGSIYLELNTATSGKTYFTIGWESFGFEGYKEKMSSNTKLFLLGRRRGGMAFGTHVLVTGFLASLLTIATDGPYHKDTKLESYYQFVNLPGGWIGDMLPMENSEQPVPMSLGRN